MVAEAAARKRRVVIDGAGTREAWMPSADLEDVRVSTLGLDDSGEIRAENMTARFSSGTRLENVQAQLAQAGFWLPLEHSDSSDATLGGCVAAGFANPLRLGYGSPRDWILGLELVSGEGRLLSAGGDVMKNVAGYDMVKVHLGAWGKLGLLTNVTVRLLPQPAGRVSVVTVGVVNAAQAERVINIGLASVAAPAALEVAGTSTGFRLLARMLGDGEWLGARSLLLQRELAAAGIEAEVECDAADEAVWAVFRSERARSARAYQWRLKASVPTSGFRGLIRIIEGSVAEGDWAVSGHGGSGVFTVYWSDEAGPLPLLDAVQRSVAPTGFVVAEGASAGALAGSERWVSFPPRARRAQDAVEARVLHALSAGTLFNQHLPRLSLAVTGGMAP